MKNQIRTKAFVGRADLLYLHNNNPKDLDVMAKFLGYEYIKEQKSTAKKEKIDAITDKSLAKTSKETIDPIPKSKEKPIFWYVAEYQLKEDKSKASQKPQWLKEKKYSSFKDGDFAMDYRKKIPKTPPLVPWRQLWPFLKSALSTPMDNRTIDLQQAIALVAKLTPIAKLPKKQRANWAPIGNIVVDFAERLTPFWDDINFLHNQLKKIRGSSGLGVYSVDKTPDNALIEYSNPTTTIANLQMQANTPLLIISDLGCFESSGNITSAWLRFGQRFAKAHLRPVVLSPCPPRLWDQELLQHFYIVWWDRGQKLPYNQCQRPPFYSLATIDESARAKRLLALLAPAIRIEPALLRAVRLTLSRKEADCATEVAVWNHKHVHSFPLALIYHKDFIELYRNAFLSQQESLRKQVIALIHKYHMHLPLPVIYEEMLTASTLQGETADLAQDFMRGYFHTIGNSKFRNQQGLLNWFYRLTQRQHAKAWKNTILMECWYKINRHNYKNGKIALKKGMCLDDIKWMLHEIPPTTLNITQIGNTFVINGQNITYDGLSTVGSQLAQLTANRAYLELLQRTRDQTLKWAFDLKNNKSIEITKSPLQGDYIVSTHCEEITIKSMQKPFWAQAMGCDPKGLFAICKDNNRISWFSPGKYQSANGKAIVMETGFWGDAAGIDQYGLYMDLSIKGIVQRMRWIPAGKFMIGSPEDEPERLSDELLHEVTLINGFWLAETACTQELWEAVMGNNPSSFKGKKRPVESVSWDNCKEFIDKINDIAPFDFRFPTEAEWEYACRAGTKTPFSFGNNITVKQVNYNGEYPYQNAPKGKYREETVETKSLPCNNWGLYEMHGNVLEWCYDWYGSYSKNSVVNPTGPDIGTVRVLRGGRWGGRARSVRSACRFNFGPGRRNFDTGFRFARGVRPDKSSISSGK